MRNITFFKPTPLYKEFLLLTMIENKANVTQRDLASALDISVAMTNNYIDEYETAGYIQRVYVTSKTVKYIITEKGVARRKLLNISYLESALDVYNEAKNDCYVFFNSIINKGFKNLIFYGAGEVAEIMLSVINNDKKIELNILAIIDDNTEKQGNSLNNKAIISFNELSSYSYDGILISTYANSDILYKKLINSGIEKNKILRFFE